MQTFLPYPDFRKSLECLDNKRLGKQRVESSTLLKTLTEGGGWSNHPATRMWKGYENSLRDYFNISVQIWVSRGFKNTYEFLDFDPLTTQDDPPWVGNEAFHASHRSNLLRKDPLFYGKYGWSEPPTLPYIWPAKLQNNPAT